MAIYRLELKAISRTSGRSISAAAAYVARDIVTDKRQQLTFDYRRKSCDLIHCEIVAPDAAPDWASERGQMWNRVEESEKRKDATTARELVLALPCELSHGDQIDAVRTFIREQITSRGLLADFALHEPDRISGDGTQPHAHVLLSTRALTTDGTFAAKKSEWLNGKFDKRAEEMTALRGAWADHLNRSLANAGLVERVSHLSRADQAAALVKEAADENASLPDRAAAAAKIEVFLQPPEAKIGHRVVGQARREIHEIERKTGEVVHITDHLTARSPAAAKILAARLAARVPAAPFVSRLSRILDHGRTVAGPGRFYGVDATASSDVGATIDVRSRATEPERTPNSSGSRHSGAIERNWGRIIEIASAIGDRVFRISKGINALIDEKDKEKDDYIKSRRQRDEAERILELTLNRVKTAERIRQLEIRRSRGRGRGR